MDSTEKCCELWKNLVIVYQQLNDGSFCCGNEIKIKETIQGSLEFADSSKENQLNVCLLGLSTINLLGKMTWQQNHQLTCTKLEWLSKNIVSADIIHNLVEMLLNCHNKHIVYGIRKCIVAFLFNYPEEISIEAENYISFIIQRTLEGKINQDILEILHDIMLFQRPQAQPFHSDSTFEFISNCKCQHVYHIDDRINEIKTNCIDAGIQLWNNLTVYLKDKNSSDNLKLITLDVWTSIFITALQFQLPLKVILEERLWKEILDVSCQSSSCICAKIFMALNQVLSINYLQVKQILPMKIIHLSKDVVTMTKSGLLDKILLKTRCNSFTGKQFYFKSSEIENICLVQLRNIVLVVLKSLSIIIKSNEQITREDTFCVLSVLVEWLSKTWTKGRKMYMNQECLMELFLDQDDQLLEMMMCSIIVYVYLQNLHRADVSSEVEIIQTFNPHVTFLHFIRQSDYDYSLLLDLLTSNETCALLYLLQYLKLVKLEWHNFVQAHQMMNERSQLDYYKLIPKCIDKRTGKDICSNQSYSKYSKVNNSGNENMGLSNKSNDIMKNSWTPSIQATFEMLIKLFSTIRNLLDKGLFPYNAQPLIHIFNDCEKLYSCSEIVGAQY